MPDRPIDINLSSSTAPSISPSNAPTPEDIKDFQVRQARVLERGYMVDRLDVSDDPDWWYEWVSKDKMSIHRMQTLDFDFPPPGAGMNKNLHDQADGMTTVGDVVLMRQPRWKHESIEKWRREEYRRTHLSNKQKEEKDYEDNNNQIGMPVAIKSQATEVSGSQIREALKPEK